MYLPLLAPAIGIAAVVVEFWPVRARYRAALIATVLAATAGLSILTIRQIGVWRDTPTLWTWVIEKQPRVAIAHYSMGEYLRARGDWDEAGRYWQRAAELEPERHRDRPRAVRSPTRALRRLSPHFGSAAGHAPRPKALPPGRLTRAKVARRLGVSVTTLRRMEGSQLHPQKDPSGVRVFDAAEVEAAFVRFRSIQHDSSRADGELAAEVFSLLDDGINPVDVVRRTHIAPDLVERLQTQWARMRRALVLMPDARARVESALLGEAFPGPDGWNIKTAKDLEGAIAEAAQPTRCISCEDRPASLCQRCSKEYAARSRARE